MIGKKIQLQVVVLLLALLGSATLIFGYFHHGWQEQDILRLLETVFFALALAVFCFVWLARHTLRELDKTKAERDLQTLELKREGDFAASLLNAAPVMILMLDTEGKIRYANPYFEQLTGFQLHDIKGRNWFKLFLPMRDHERIKALFESIDTATSIKGNVNPIVIRNGEERDISWSCEPVCDVNGKLAGVISIGEDVTERYRRAREQERNAAVIRFASDFIALCDLNGDLQFINQAGTLLLGLSKKQSLPDLCLSNILMGGILPGHREMENLVVDHGRWLGEHQFRHVSTGDPIPVALDMFRIDDPNNGEPVNFGLVARDLREQKAIAAAMEKNQWRLNEAQRIAKVGSWELEIDTGQLIWTDEIFRLFELDKANFQPAYETFLNTIHPDDKETVHQAFTKSLVQHSPYQIIHRLLMPDGRIKWVEECGYTYFDGGGNPIRTWGTVQDITKSYTEAKATATARIELQSVIDAATEFSVIATDEDGMVTLFNEGAQRMLGYKPEEIVAIKTAIFFHVPAEVLKTGRFLSKQYGQSVAGLAVLFEPARQGDFHPREWKYVRKDGSTLPVSLTVTARRDTQGQTVGYLLVASDITERKRTEAAMNNLNEALEQRVEERTSELVKARDEAQRANHAKSQFLSRMSHELRTPLNAIIGFGQLLETDMAAPLNGDQLESVQEIVKAGRHLLDLINEILDLARIESGHMALAMEVVALEPLLDECIHLFQPLVAQRQITLHYNRDSWHEVHADRLRLRKIILNLLANAIKYNRDSGQIWVSCSQSDGAMVRIAFKDTGIGISEQDIPKLFKPFERLGSAYSGVEGSGIGLALCKQLIEAMGGKIGVQSQPHEGSLFWVDCKPCEQEKMGVQKNQAEVKALSG